HPPIPSTMHYSLPSSPLLFQITPPPPISPLFPYTTLFRSAIRHPSDLLDWVDGSPDFEPGLAHALVDIARHAVALEPRVRLVDHRVIARPHTRRVRDLRSVHHDLSSGVLERPGHADVVGMQVRDEHAPHVAD